MPISRSARAAVVLIVACVIAAAMMLVLNLTSTVLSTEIPFDNDEANHAIDGWEVALALRAASPPELYRTLTDQGFYPPVHSLFLATAYLFAGASLASSRAVSVILFLLTLVALAWLMMRQTARDAGADRGDRWLAAAVATLPVALAITSLIYVSHAVLVMLEMTGALFAILLLLAADQTDVQRAGWRRWLWLLVSAGCATATFLTKYSFGLFFLPALLAALLTAAPPWKVGLRAWKEAIAVGLVSALLIGLWIAMTDRPSMVLFFFDHRSDAHILSAENLLYVPRVWVSHYSASPLVALLVVLLALYGALRCWVRLAVRVAAWSVVVGLVVTTVSTTNEARHFLPVAPAIWFLSALGLSEILLWLRRRSDSIVPGVLLLSTLLLLIAFGARPQLMTLNETLKRSFEGESTFLAVQQQIAAQIDPDQPLLLIGDLDDQHGLLAVRWHVATHFDRSLWDLEIDFFPFEQYSHSLERTHRKGQRDVSAPEMPHTYMNEVLDPSYYPMVIEVKKQENYFGPRAANPADPLCRYSATEVLTDGWVVTIYDVRPSGRPPCDDS